LIDFNTSLASDEVTLFSDCVELVEFGILVNSVPEDAAISIDGVSTGLSTPAIIEDLAPGNYELRLSKSGYNDYIYDLNYDGGAMTVSAVMTQPEPPTPFFTIISPIHEASYSSNVVTLSGTVQMEMPNGDIVDFDGNTATLTLNGVDQQVGVNSNGHFNAQIGINQGYNTLRMRASSQGGDTGYSDSLVIYGDFAADDIVVILGWNTPTSDLDLHVWNPAGEHCYYGHPSISEGFLDIDDVEGYGPETFTAQNALNGTYTVMINSYSLDSDDYSDAGVTLVLDGATPQTFGPHHFVTADGNGTNPSAWWTVIEFTMNAGTKSQEVVPSDPERMAKIQEDIQSLPRK